MDKIPPITTFRTGYAGARHVIGLSGAMDAFAPDEPYSRLFMFNERAPKLWTFNEHQFVVPALCLWRDPRPPGARSFAALSENGVLVLLGAETCYENISDGGLGRPGAAGYGYLSGLRQVGGHLYACGYAGQVYKRHDTDDWRHMDYGLLQSVGISDGGYAAQVIDGPDENSIYLVGSENRRGYPPRADHWDGHEWTRLSLPPEAGRLTNILVESPARIWLVGSKGTLLLGNAVDGFRSFGPLGEKKLLLSVALHDGVGYLATNVGLFKFDPAKPGGGFVKVRTGLVPELQDANVVQSVEGVLWSLGSKDLVRLDGNAWQRFHHPDNPPIHAAALP